MTAYDAEKFSQGYPPDMEKYWWNLARNKIIAKELKKYISKEDIILEVGCGKGVVTNYLQANGWRVIGIDPGRPSETNFKDRHIIYGSSTKDLAKEMRQEIKVLALFDVIEHVPNPVSFIADQLKALPCLKRIILTVPARQELWGSFDDYYGHFRRYTIKQLNDEMISIGIKPIMSEYMFRLVYFAILFLKKIHAPRPVAFKPPQTCASIWFHRILADVLIWENTFFHKTIPGSSIIAIYTV